MTAAALPAGETVVPYECIARGNRVIGVRALPHGVTIRQAPASTAGLSLPQGDALFELVRNGRVVGLAQLPAATSYVRRALPPQSVVDDAGTTTPKSRDAECGGKIELPEPGPAELQRNTDTPKPNLAAALDVAAAGIPIFPMRVFQDAGGNAACKCPRPCRSQAAPPRYG